ncbi:hypothetical protein Btru_073369 [Bulinus truncatus]|nr:hypothetical protein Btru_073369 [Bulinus truncatus]
MSDIRFTKARNDNRIRHTNDVSSKSDARINDSRGVSRDSKEERGKEPPWHIFITSKADDRNDSKPDLRKVDDRDDISSSPDTEALTKQKVKSSSGAKEYKPNDFKSKGGIAGPAFHETDHSKSNNFQRKAKDVAPIHREIKDSENHDFYNNSKLYEIKSSPGKVNESGYPVDLNVTQEHGNKKETDRKSHKRLDNILISSSVRDTDNTLRQPATTVPTSNHCTKQPPLCQPATSFAETSTEAQILHRPKPVLKNTREKVGAVDHEKRPIIDTVKKSDGEHTKSAEEDKSNAEHKKSTEAHNAIRVAVSDYMRTATDAHRQKLEKLGQPGTEVNVKRHLADVSHVPPCEPVTTTVQRKMTSKIYGQHECSEKVNRELNVHSVHQEKARQSKSSVHEQIENYCIVKHKEKYDGKSSVSRESYKQPVKRDLRKKPDSESRSHNHHQRRHHGYSEENTQSPQASDFHIDKKSVRKEQITESPALKNNGSQRYKENNETMKRNNRCLETTVFPVKETKQSPTPYRKHKEGLHDSKHGKPSSLSALPTAETAEEILPSPSLTSIEKPSPTCTVSPLFTFHETPPFRFTEVSTFYIGSASSPLNFTETPPLNHSETSPVICSLSPHTHSADTPPSTPIIIAENTPPAPGASATTVHSTLSIFKSNYLEHVHSSPTSVKSNLNTQTYFCPQGCDEHPVNSKISCQCKTGNKRSSCNVQDHSMDVNVLTFIQDDMMRKSFKDEWIETNQEGSSKSFAVLNGVHQQSPVILKEDAKCKMKFGTQNENLCTLTEFQSQSSLNFNFQDQTTVADQLKKKSNIKQELCNLPPVNYPEQQQSLQQPEIQFFSKDKIEQTAVETTLTNQNFLNETDLKHRVLSAQQTLSGDNHRDVSKQGPALAHGTHHSAKEKNDSDVSTKHRSYQGGHLSGREQLVRRRLPIKRSVSSGALSVRDNNTSFFRRMNDSYFYDDATDSDDYDDVGVDLDEMLKQLDSGRSRKPMRNQSFSSNIENNFSKTDAILSGNATMNDSCKSIRETVSCDRLKIRRGALADPLRMIMSQEDRERIERDVQRRRQSMARKVSQFINIQLDQSMKLHIYPYFIPFIIRSFIHMYFTIYSKKKKHYKSNKNQQFNEFHLQHFLSSRISHYPTLKRSVIIRLNVNEFGGHTRQISKERVIHIKFVITSLHFTMFTSLGTKTSHKDEIRATVIVVY